MEGKMKNEYRKIESTLELLLMALSDSFSECESIEVQEFIDAGEYGIALQTLIDIIEEESKSISKEALLLAKKAGECMNMDSNTIEKRVSRYVKKTG
ncbi:isoleucyl-tRNA synthetase [Alcanivorax nanhaiticus]|uniref:Isoleucyl-tRNA synthetase n=1 Tax=Alcanivorax nanhaiticus TaxID=1177154 RepID=A0A095SFI5_9GAMM|nr:isoleucyl-tRNA synthetase [Alcanivorax nanhaiticus]